MALGLCFCLVYYILIFITISRCKIKEIFLGYKRYICIVLLLLSIFWIWLCIQNCGVPVWDRASYWVKCIEFQDILRDNWTFAIKDVYYSIDLTDYSDVVPMIISVPFMINNSYIWYRVLLFFMFHIPTFILLVVIIGSMLNKIVGEINNIIVMITLLICLCSTFLYLPTIYGLFDVADMPIACSIVLLLMNVGISEFNIKDCLLLSVLFLVLLFIRRHFSFFALGYFGLYIIIEFIEVIYKRDYKILKKIVINTVVIGILCLSVLLLFFRQYLIRTLFNNYSVQYGARSIGSMSDKFVATFLYIGIYFLILSVAGCIWLIKKKRTKDVLLNVGSTAFIMAMFFRIQSLSCQHYFNFAIQIVVLSTIGAYAIISQCKNWRLIIEILIISVGCLSFIKGIVPNVTISNYFSLLPGAEYSAQRRNDMREINRLKDDIVKYTDLYNTTAYVTSSSVIFTDDVIRNIELPSNINPVESLAYTRHTDMADGFPTDFLKSGILITTNPSLIHARKDGQRIVWVLNELIGHPDNPLYDNYKLVEEYNLDQGVEAYMWIKQKSLSSEDYSFLIDTFDLWYKDYPELFKNRIEDTARDLSVVYEVDNYDDCLLVTDDDTIVTRCNLSDSSLINELQFTIGTNGKTLGNTTFYIKITDDSGDVISNQKVNLKGYNDFSELNIYVSSVNDKYTDSILVELYNFDIYEGDNLIFLLNNSSSKASTTVNDKEYENTSLKMIVYSEL